MPTDCDIQDILTLNATKTQLNKSSVFNHIVIQTFLNLR